jgi:hypothetical protein
LNYFLGRWQGATGVACSILIREAVMTILFVRLWKLPAPAKSVGPVMANAECATLLNT